MWDRAEEPCAVRIEIRGGRNVSKEYDSKLASSDKSEDTEKDVIKLVKKVKRIMKKQDKKFRCLYLLKI